MPTYGPEMEGRTATSKDGKTRIIIRNGEAVRDDSYVPQGAKPGARVDPTTKDLETLNKASARAAAERDALRTYGGAARAVTEMGTGPVHARWLDAIMPDEDGGVWDTIGAFIGTIPRALTDQKTLDARDHLKTINAAVALAGSQDLKGAASDKDMALMRLRGMGPYKHPSENHRIIQDAAYRSGLEQARALITANWVAQYGSLANPSANGRTFEQVLQLGEQKYNQLWEQRQAEKRAGKSRLPKAPPRKKRGSGPVTIDLNGNIIE